MGRVKDPGSQHMSGRGNSQPSGDYIDIKWPCCTVQLPTRPTNKTRSIQSLYSLGLPIIQGALSTILSVLALAFSSAYVFQVFFKTMLLVIGFGALHGLVFLPVLLRLFVGGGEQLIAHNLKYVGLCVLYVAACLCAMCGACDDCCEDIGDDEGCEGCCSEHKSGNGVCGTLWCLIFVAVLVVIFGSGPPPPSDIIVILPTPNPLCPSPTFPLPY